MKKVLAFIDVVDGQPGEIGYELLDFARQAAPEAELVAVGAGPQAALEGLAGADRALWTVADGYRPDLVGEVLTAAIVAEQPDLVLVGSTAVGMDAGTYAAAKSGYASIAYVRSLEPLDGSLAAQSVILGGKMVARVAVPDRTVLQVLAGAGSAERGRVPGRPAQVGTLAEPAAKASFEGFGRPEAQDVDITRHDVLVSVGRGIGDASNIELAEELAEALGGVVSSSRPVVDAGWLPKARQVGKSGNKVKPKVYLALGISGAPEHLEGMRDAACIIAVNTDPAAPIFEVAHYGVVDDVLDFIPALTESLRVRQG